MWQARVQMVWQAGEGAGGMTGNDMLQRFFSIEGILVNNSTLIN